MCFLWNCWTLSSVLLWNITRFLCYALFFFFAFPVFVMFNHHADSILYFKCFTDSHLNFVIWNGICFSYPSISIINAIWQLHSQTRPVNVSRFPCPMTSIDMDSKWHEWILAASRHWCRLRLTSRIAVLTERFEGVNIGGTGGSSNGGGGVGR